jgi:hypothetical protein
MWRAPPPRSAYVGGRPEPPSVWGPKRWRKGHLLAIRYAAVPTECERAQAFMDFWTLIHNLPCSECRKHATQYARRYPPDFSSSRGYQLWFWRFHNAVNRRLKKKIVSWDEYLSLFQADLAEVRQATTPAL